MKALRVASFTAEGRNYIVWPDAQHDQLRCECPAWRRDRPCKHVRIYEATQRAVSRCRLAGHQPSLDSDQLCATCVASLLVAAAKRAAAKEKEGARAARKSAAERRGKHRAVRRRTQS